MIGRKGGEIVWRVAWYIGGERGRDDFEGYDKANAEDLYELLKSTLSEENDRVVLYRLKWKGYRPGYYQDTRRSAIVNPEGEIIVNYGASPNTWEAAKERSEYQKAYKLRLASNYRLWNRLDDTVDDPEVYSWARREVEYLEEPDQYVKDMRAGKKVPFTIGYGGTPIKVNLTLDKAKELSSRVQAHKAIEPSVGPSSEVIEALSDEELDSIRSVRDIYPALSEKSFRLYDKEYKPAWDRGLERIVREAEEEDDE